MYFWGLKLVIIWPMPLRQSSQLLFLFHLVVCFQLVTEQLTFLDLTFSELILIRKIIPEQLLAMLK